MPNQSIFVSISNQKLKEIKNIDFGLNKNGVCSALVALYIEAFLNQKTYNFFYKYNRICCLNKEDSLDPKSDLYAFIIKIEEIHNLAKYSHFTLHNDQIETKILVHNKKPANEFNIGLITHEANWEQIIKDISFPNRAYRIGSHNHAIAFSYRNGIYTLYDPNFKEDTKEYKSAKELILAIKRSFSYPTEEFGLSIKVFASSDDPIKPTYPSKESIHKSIFPTKELIEKQFSLKDRTYPSSLFASDAKDKETLDFLVKNNAIEFEESKLNIYRQVLSPFFNQNILSHSKGTNVRQYFLIALKENFAVGNIDLVLEIINKYEQDYLLPQDTEDLKKTLNLSLETLDQSEFEPISNHKNYEPLLEKINKYSLSSGTNTNHLKILNALHHNKEIRLEIQDPNQWLKQIYIAAKANHLTSLNFCIGEFKNRSKDEITTSFFTKELLTTINEQTLATLFENGFIADKDLIHICLQRKNRGIVELYFQNFLNKTNKDNRLQQFYNPKKNMDLTIQVGSVYILDINIYLKKNEFIKNNWPQKIDNNTIENALFYALMCENKEIVSFLKSKLSTDNQDFYGDIYNLAIENENLILLNLLSSIQINILTKQKDLNKILNMCYDQNDYSCIDQSLPLAKKEMKKALLIDTLYYSIDDLIRLFKDKEALLIAELFGELIENKSFPKRTILLNQLNKYCDLLPQNIFLNLNTTYQKADLKKLCTECYEHKRYRLASVLSKQILLEEKDLNDLILKLIEAKKEHNIISLLKDNPKALNYPNLVNECLGNKLYLATAYILKKQKQPEYNFKDLFLKACADQDARAANSILAEDIQLSNEEIERNLGTLFPQKTSKEIYETIYENSYGRLFILLTQVDKNNPRSELLSSIREPLFDPKLGKSNLLFKLLQEPLIKGDKQKFDSIVKQIKLSKTPNTSALSFIKNNHSHERIDTAFDTHYTLKQLLESSIQNKAWATIAILLEYRTFSDLSEDLIQKVREHREAIIDAFLFELNKDLDKHDPRKRLFDLLNPFSEKTALKELATEYQDKISKILLAVEQKMSEEKYNFNRTSYVHSFSIDAIKDISGQISEKAYQCLKLMNNHKINLKEPIKSKELIDLFGEIKSLIADEERALDYIDEKIYDFIEELMNNSRFKRICELETGLYFLMMQLDLFDNKSVNQCSLNQQEIFNKTLYELDEAMQEQGITEDFIVPKIRLYLKEFLKNKKREEQEPLVKLPQQIPEVVNPDCEEHQQDDRAPKILVQEPQRVIPERQQVVPEPQGAVPKPQDAVPEPKDPQQNTFTSYNTLLLGSGLLSLCGSASLVVGVLAIIGIISIIIPPVGIGLAVGGGVALGIGLIGFGLFGFLENQRNDKEVHGPSTNTVTP